MTTLTGDFGALREKPFELLRAMEVRAREAMAGGSGEAASQWTGIGFRLGGDSFVVDRDEIREVMLVPQELTRVPGSRNWMRGLANVRGHLLPIVDLKGFLAGRPAAASDRTSRVLVLNRADVPVGLLVDEVFGFRRFLPREFSDQAPQTALGCEALLAGGYGSEGQNWPVFSMDRLVRSDEFLDAAEH